MRRLATSAMVVGLVTVGAYGQITVPGADGADGPFNPSSSVEVDLSLARTGAWDSPHTDPNQAGKGVYDPKKWAVVFRYTEVNIPSGKTVTFKNHPSGAPVVWLVSGLVSIAGFVDVSGQQGQGSANYAEGGPGGFRGGREQAGNALGSYGFGPGGGGNSSMGDSGSYGTVGYGTSPGEVYGDPAIVPLIGGSGGGGDRNYQWEDVGGGAGGGAILIACPDTMSIPGNIYANGGKPEGCHGGGGSGGAIRLIAGSIELTGQLRAIGGTRCDNTAGGGAGRIRLETFAITQGGEDTGSPVPSIVEPGETARIWPESDAPRIRCTELAGAAVPEDPRSLNAHPADVQLATLEPVVLRIQAENIPTDGSWTVVAQIVPWSGDRTTSNAAFVSGTPFLSVWETQFTLPKGNSAIQVRAYKNPSP